MGDESWRREWAKDHSTAAVRQGGEEETSTHLERRGGAKGEAAFCGGN